MATKSILVTGEFILDHHIYEGQRHHYGDRVEDGVKVHPQIGGAALVHQILEMLVKPEGPPQADSWSTYLAVEDPSAAPESSVLDASEHAYAFWRPYPTRQPREKQFWRVSEAMGFGAGGAKATRAAWTAATKLPPEPEIVVISEGGMGFRDSPREWHAEKLAKARWIVLKTAAPVGVGPLWEHLSVRDRRRLILIVSARELRKLPARLSAGLSWEETIADLTRELGPSGTLGALTSCRHLIVTCDSEGAIWFDLAGKTVGTLAAARRVHFLYEASSIEGDRTKAVEGSGFGFLSCLTASVVRQLTLDIDSPDIAAGLAAGLSAIRDLREKGHGPASEAPAGFPAERIGRAISSPAFHYSHAVFPSDAPLSGSRWSVLRQAERTSGPAYDLARLVLLRGPIALADLPHLRIGQFLTADRHEIESLRTVVQIIGQYQRHDPGKKPLSIGVFGPPGAGKSFVVREMADHLVGSKGWMEFNLSQFNEPEDLIGAFHQIRDKVLQGLLPVAFFDEFDAQSYRWLKHLLAPMQDGRFQEGQLTHTLGKSILVFAGGTSWTFETFGPPTPESASTVDDGPHRDFRLAKGPDFKSRFDGYINVSGPNRRFAAPSRTGRGRHVEAFGGRLFGEDPDDVQFPIRRALMIRAELKCGADEKLEMDEGLVHALLHVDRYTHGARSLTKVLQSLAAGRPGPLRRSLLMPGAQLAMHVPSAAFIALCTEGPAQLEQSRLTRPQVEVIAPAIHETFNALGRKAGWLQKKDEKAFVDLSDFFQESNRAAASRMLDNLSLIGCQLVTGIADAVEEQSIRDRLEYRIEALAEAEHDGWMDWHLSRGWKHGPKKSETDKTHPCLRPFTQLPNGEADKDRDAVRHYPDFARAAGMKIVLVDAPERQRRGTKTVRR